MKFDFCTFSCALTPTFSAWFIPWLPPTLTPTFPFWFIPWLPLAITPSNSNLVCYDFLRHFPPKFFAWFIFLSLDFLLDSLLNFQTNLSFVGFLLDSFLNFYNCICPLLTSPLIAFSITVCICIWIFVIISLISFLIRFFILILNSLISILLISAISFIRVYSYFLLLESCLFKGFS